MSIFHLVTLIGLILCLLGWACTFLSLRRCGRYNAELIANLDTANEKVRTIRNELNLCYAGLINTETEFKMVQQVGRGIRSPDLQSIKLDHA